MLTISSLIEFLLDLLRDDEAMEQFDRDPQAMLAQHGLGDITAQDIRDVRPLLVDQGYLQRRDDDVGGTRRQHDRDDCGDDDGGGGDDDGSRHRDDDGGGSRRQHHDDDDGGRHRDDGDRPDRHDRHDGGGSRHQDRDDDDPVEEIHHVRNEYTVVEQHNTYNEYNYYVDDRDTIVVGDDNTVVQDSYNQDNDGVDNKGGVIEDSTVAGGDMDNSSDDDTLVNDSFDDESDNSTDNSVDGSLNGNDLSDNSDHSDNSVDVDDSGNDNSVDMDDSGNDNSVDIDGSGNDDSVDSVEVTGSAEDGLGSSFAAEDTSGSEAVLEPAESVA